MGAFPQRAKGAQKHPLIFKKIIKNNKMGDFWGQPYIQYNLA